MRQLSTAPRLKFLRNLQQLTDRQGDLDALSLQRALQMGFRLPRPKTLKNGGDLAASHPCGRAYDRAALYGPFRSPYPLRRSSRSMSSACLAAGIYASVGAHDRAGPGRPTTEDKAMRMILAAAVLAALALQASAKDDPHGPQWHFMDHGADMHLAIRPWC